MATTRKAKPGAKPTTTTKGKKPPAPRKPRARGEKPAHEYPSGLTPSMEENLSATLDLMPGFETLAAMWRSGKAPLKEALFFKYLDQDRLGAYRERYARARDAMVDTMVQSAVDISDDAAGDIYEDADGNPRVDHENIQRSKLRVETRKWLAGKLSPKRYGDKLQMEVQHSLADATVDELIRRIEEVAETYGVIFPDGMLRRPEQEGKA